MAFILGGIAVAHIFAPSHVQIDWPTITLVVIALILVFWSEIVAILPYIKRLRLGDAEIEMRDEVAKLYENVEKIESTLPTPRERIPIQKAELNLTGRRSEADILELAARDKEAALILLVIEIEKELARLSGHKDEPDKSRTIRETLDRLVREDAITRDLADTVLTFRDVRNMVVHPIRQMSVDKSILTSAIDSGVRILRILRSR